MAKPPDSRDIPGPDPSPEAAASSGHAGSARPGGPDQPLDYDRSAAALGRTVYLCLSCGHKWISRPVPEACNACGHPYVKWLNYFDRKW